MTLKSVHTLLDVLHFADSHTAIVVPELGIRVTYDSLRKQVFDMANALASLGIRRGDAVSDRFAEWFACDCELSSRFHRRNRSSLEPGIPL